MNDPINCSVDSFDTLLERPEEALLFLELNRSPAVRNGPVELEPDRFWRLVLARNSGGNARGG